MALEFEPALCIDDSAVDFVSGLNKGVRNPSLPFEDLPSQRRPAFSAGKVAFMDHKRMVELISESRWHNLAKTQAKAEVYCFLWGTDCIGFGRAMGASNFVALILPIHLKVLRMRS